MRRCNLCPSPSELPMSRKLDLHHSLFLGFVACHCRIHNLVPTAFLFLSLLSLHSLFLFPAQLSPFSCEYLHTLSSDAARTNPRGFRSRGFRKFIRLECRGSRRVSTFSVPPFFSLPLLIISPLARPLAVLQRSSFPAFSLIFSLSALATRCFQS